MWTVISLCSKKNARLKQQNCQKVTKIDRLTDWHYVSSDTDWLTDHILIYDWLTYWLLNGWWTDWLIELLTDLFLHLYLIGALGGALLGVIGSVYMDRSRAEANFLYGCGIWMKNSGETVWQNMSTAGAASMAAYRYRQPPVARTHYI